MQESMFAAWTASQKATEPAEEEDEGADLNELNAHLEGEEEEILEEDDVEGEK